jgi:hypothetical protein
MRYEHKITYACLVDMVNNNRGKKEILTPVPPDESGRWKLISTFTENTNGRRFIFWTWQKSIRPQFTRPRKEKQNYGGSK